MNALVALAKPDLGVLAKIDSVALTAIEADFAALLEVLLQLRLFGTGYGRTGSTRLLFTGGLVKIYGIFQNSPLSYCAKGFGLY